MIGASLGRKQTTGGDSVPRQPGGAPGPRERILAALSRKTTSGRVIPEIDGLRFVAVAMVVLYHLSGYLAVAPGHGWSAAPLANPVGWFLDFGGNGVQLFFVISGFVLGLPFVAQYLADGNRVVLGSYFKRRLTRLEPPYLLAMAGCYVMVIVTKHLSPAELFPELLAHLTYVHSLTFGIHSPINVVAWSLEVEVQFYILAPVLAAAFMSIRNAAWRRGAILAFSVSMALVVAALKNPSVDPPPSLLLYQQYFLMGFLLADIYVTSWKKAPTQHLKYDALWVASWVVLTLVWNWKDSLVSVAVYPFAALALCIAGFRSVYARKALSNPWIVVTGGMCYTIYLLHYPLISAVGRISTVRLPSSSNFAVDLLIQAAVVIPVILLVSAVYFVLVERPCMDKDWPAKLRARIRTLRPRPAAAPVTDVVPLG